MKKLLSLLLASIMILSTASLVSADGSIQIYHYSQFENEREGAVTALNGWSTVNPDSNEMKIVSNPEQTGKCLKIVPIYGTPGGPFMEYAHESGTPQYMIVEGRFRLDNHSACKIVLQTTVSGTRKALFTINESRQMVDVNGNTVISPFTNGEFVKVALAIDKENATYDIYLNDRKVQRDIAFAAISGAAISAFRVSVIEIASGCRTELYLDDFAIYSSSTEIPVRGCELSDVISVHDGGHLNDGFLYVMNTPRMLRRGYSVSFESTETLAPQIVRENPYIPLRYSIEMLDGGVGYSADTNTATITYKGNSLTAVPGENAEMLNGHMLIDAHEFAEFVGKKIWYDEKSGVVFISDRTVPPNFHADIDALNDGIAKIIFDRPDTATVLSDIQSTTSAGSHPRLFVDAQRVEEIRELCLTDEFMIKEKEAVLKQADKLLSAGPQERVASGSHYLSACQNVRVRIPALAMAYLLTEDVKYAERVWTEVNYVCTEWEDWNHWHFLDTIEVTFPIALAYDWLYDYWTEDQRKVMEDALMTRGVREIVKDYKDLPRERRKGGWVNLNNNWNIICYGGVAAAALALYDASPEYEADCIDMLSLGLRNMEKALMTYSPDGGYVEGPGYWDYASMYLGFTVSMLQSAAGEDYGIMQLPGLKKTGYHNIDLYGPGGMFNFSDSGEGQTCTSATIWFSKAFKDPLLLALYKDMKENISFSTYYPFMDILYYDETLAEEAESVERSLDSMYRHTEIVTMRNNWDLTSSNFIGLHAGRNNQGHPQLDAGTFVLDMNGKRFALDLGAGTYEETGGLFRYRYSAQGHNTYVVNPDSDYTQNREAFTYITRYDSNDYEGYAIADITDAYTGKLSKFKRGIYATEAKSVFLVQDELSAAKPAEAYWQMHTEADIEISESGKEAILTLDTDCVIVRLLTDNDAVFEVRECMPYDGTPYYQVSDSDAFAQKLVLHLENVTEETVAVEFQHYLKGQDMPEQYFTVTSLNEWELGEIKEEWLAEAPVLTSVSLNGVALETFSSTKRNYSVSLDGSEVEALDISATADDDTAVSVEYPDEYPGAVLITATNDEVSNTYSVYVKPIYSLEELLGAEKIAITAVEASAEPELDNGKENTLDGSLDTRWSAQGSGQYIQYKLEETKEVSYVNLAFYRGDARISYFDVYTSMDGSNWKKVYTAESSGQTLDMETYKLETVDKANYIRIVCQGTSASKEGWNSITEFSAYGN